MFCEDWLNKVFFRYESLHRCVAMTYVRHLTFNICEYIVVTITLSRFVAIVYPMKAAKTTNRPKCVVAAIVVTSCLINLYFLWITELTKRKTKYRKKPVVYTCTIGQHNSSTITFFMWFQTTVSFIIPMLFILTANTRIIWELKLKKRKRSQWVRAQREAERKEENKVTIMLVIMTFVFLILILPWFVWHMRKYFMLAKYKPSPKASAVILLAKIVCLKLLYSNNAVNFYLYVLFGSDFRKELKKVFLRSNRVRTSTNAVWALNVHSNTTRQSSA